MTFTSELRKRFGKEPVFRASDVRAFFSRQRLSTSYCNLMLYNLVKTGELFRIARGTYTFREDAEAVGFAFQPFYYGLQDALSLRGLWEQETTPVVITPRRVRAGLRSFMGSNYTVRRISRAMFFGFEMVKISGLWVPISDAEKTLIDLVYFRQPISKEALGEIKRRMRKEVMEGYLRRVPSYLRKKVRAVLSR